VLPSDTGSTRNSGTSTRAVAKPRLNSGHAIARRLDDDLAFLFLLDLPLPSIERGHRRQDVDAGGETLVDERTRDRLGARRCRNRREDQDNVNDVLHSSPSMPGSRVVDVASSLAVSSWRFNVVVLRV
jgi:hypothetical protein